MYLKMVTSALAIYALISGMVFFESTQGGEKFSVISTLPYLGFITIQFIGFMIEKLYTARTLFVFSLINICLLMVTTFTGGNIALWTIITVGLFNSFRLGLPI